MTWQKYIGYAIALLAYTGLAVGIGWTWRGERVQKQITQTVEKAKDASDMVLPDLSGRLVQLERDKVLLEEALKNASNNAGCIFTRGDVSLLNHARTGLPDAAAGADAEGRAPAAYSQREEIAAHTNCGTRYRDLAAKHDALIDWLVLSGRK